MDMIDPDEEANGKLMCKIAQSSATFEINPFDGVIMTQKSPNFFLDHERIPNYTLITIVVQDLGSRPKHQVLTIIRVRATVMT